MEFLFTIAIVAAIFIPISLWAISLAWIPIAGIIRIAIEKDKSGKWKTWWIIAILLLWLPGFIFGAMHFKKKKWRIWSVIVLVLTVALYSTQLFFHYKDTSDFGEAVIRTLENEEPSAFQTQNDYEKKSNQTLFE